MDATCTIQDSIHVFNLVHKYVSRILGTYQDSRLSFGVFFEIRKIPQTSLLYTYFYWGEKVKQKEFPQHTFFTSYTDTRNTPHNIAA